MTLFKGTLHFMSPSTHICHRVQANRRQSSISTDAARATDTQPGLHHSIHSPFLASKTAGSYWLLHLEKEYNSSPRLLCITRNGSARVRMRVKKRPEISEVLSQSSRDILEPSSGDAPTNGLTSRPKLRIPARLTRVLINLRSFLDTEHKGPPSCQPFTASQATHLHSKTPCRLGLIIIQDMTWPSYSSPVHLWSCPSFTDDCPAPDYYYTDKSFRTSAPSMPLRQVVEHRLISSIQFFSLVCLCSSEVSP